jgi:hypothetical protein
MTGAPRIGLVRLLAQREGIREIIFAAFAALVYFGIRNLTAGSVGTAYANADRVMRFERATHLVAAFPSLHFG